MLDTARDTLQGLANARGRSAGHVGIGLVLCGGALALTLASRKRQAPAQRTTADVVGAVWRPVAVALALSGLRIWNAPDSPERNRALGFWGVLLGLNAALGLMAQRHRGARLAAAAAGLGASAVYLTNARKVDATAASLVSPRLGWSRISSVGRGAVSLAGAAVSHTLH